ncbi:pentapeptide repeat-containing protein [Rhizobium oryzicola]|uniref:Pentapeptide repeat-containing protein n=1 Tax=Rhizobium oryzicola TaxID=1232668 RepID=A0ABT8SS21_9HYPH|nr:pentapeptide repeat-containing protein [Rhizobium oryzicola]MDO1581218.1 pentapeptide repeat-containing protein [Rhizobium oryzicola]
MSDLLEALRSPDPIIDRRFEAEDLVDAHISTAEFRRCRFSNCVFEEAKFRSVKFVGCVFDHCRFKEAAFEDCIFCEGETACEWRYCDLSKAEFHRCNLSLNKTIGCDAYLLVLKDCAAPGIRLDLNCQKKVRTQVIGGGVNFTKCKLQYAHFAASDYRESRLESCDLRDVTLSGCDLSHSSLRGSSLNNCDLTGAILDHADLSHATFDQLDLQALQSFHAAIVTRDQHEALVTSLGFMTAD